MDDIITRKEFNEYVKRMEAEHEHLHEVLNECKIQMNEVHSIAISTEKLACNMEHMLNELKRQQDVQEKHDIRIENLEARDGEMWRKLVGYAVTAIAGIIIGYIFKQIGM